MDESKTTPSLTADTSGSDFTPQSYDIDPEDRELANQLANFDPVRDTAGPVQFTGGTLKEPERFTLDILSPEQRGPIAAELANLPASNRAAREHELVAAALRRNSLELRIKAGPGAGANPFQKERLQIAREVHELESEEFNLQLELAKVDRWVPVFDKETGEPVTDPATGKQQLEPVFAVQGDNRRGMEARAKELLYRAQLLKTVEGDRREERALKATVEQHKETQRQLEEEREAKQMAETILREERVKARAEARAKHKRNTL